MIESEALKVVRMLRHAFPRQNVPTETAEVYVAMLLDLDYTTTDRAAKRLITTNDFFPTIAEIRRAVAESTVGAPGDVAAWELVTARLNHEPEWVDCPDCNGRGWTSEKRVSMEGVEVPAQLREAARKAGVETVPRVVGDGDEDVICLTCRGEGRRDGNPLQPLPPLVRKALDLCGGLAAIRHAENPTVVRAQFRDTYRELRADAVSGLQTGERPALAPTEKLALPMPELKGVPRG